MKTSLIIFSLLFSSLTLAQVYKPNTDLFLMAKWDNAGKTPEVILDESLKNFEAFVALEIDNSLLYRSDKKKPTFTTKEVADAVMAEAMSNPVVSTYYLAKYDSRGVGFCFGRAMFVNIYMAMGGFNRAHVKKAFLVGPMSHGAWGWHVTTIVESRDAEGKEIWLAIDPAVGHVMEVKDWYKNWYRFSDDKKLRLYVAEAGKFGVTPSRYDELDMTNDFYKNYFNDMMAWFETNSEHVAELLVPKPVVEVEPEPTPEVIPPIDPLI